MVGWSTAASTRAEHDFDTGQIGLDGRLVGLHGSQDIGCMRRRTNWTGPAFLELLMERAASARAHGDHVLLCCAVFAWEHVRASAQYPSWFIPGGWTR
eukprot:365835-Chlamydomonas_euryale.AAC.1